MLEDMVTTSPFECSCRYHISFSYYSETYQISVSQTVDFHVDHLLDMLGGSSMLARMFPHRCVGNKNNGEAAEGGLLRVHELRLRLRTPKSRSIIPAISAVTAAVSTVAVTTSIVAATVTSATIIAATPTIAMRRSRRMIAILVTILETGDVGRGDKRLGVSLA